VGVRAPLEQRPHRRLTPCNTGPVDTSFRALSERLTFTVRRHKFNKDSPHSLHPRVLCYHLHGVAACEERNYPNLG